MKAPRWIYAVTYRTPSGTKDRKFSKREIAQKFVDRLREHEVPFDFYRFGAEPWWRRFIRADLYWLGWRIKMKLFVPMLLLAIFLIYEWSKR